MDKETSGLILVAKKRSALTALSALFAERIIKKTYLALLQGSIRKKTVIEQPLGILRQQGIRKAIPEENGQSAKTTFIPLKKIDGYTLCLALPETGRMHQIRAHALLLNAPILGDKLYGQDEKHKLHLHAAKLEFSYKGERWVFETEPPSCWDESLFAGWNLWKTINQLQN